jgi:hypothetical protein
VSTNVAAGLVQLGIAAGLLYAFWIGAFTVLIEGLTGAVRGQDPGDLSAALLAGRSR